MMTANNKVSSPEETKQNKAKIKVPLNHTDWQNGFNAGSSGIPHECTPDGADNLSWISGWIEGNANRKK